MTGTILIVDSVATNRIVLRMKLGAACYDVLQAADGASVLRMARRYQPDLILLDGALEDADVPELCAVLRDHPLTAQVPVVVMTAGHDPHLPLRALRSGAVDVLAKPVEDSVLLAHVRGLLRAKEAMEELRQRGTSCQPFGMAEPGAGFTTPARIALVAPRAELAMAWRQALSPFLRDELVICDRAQALAGASDNAADLYVVAADLARPGDGLQLLSELRSRTASRHSAICMVLPARGHDLAAMALDLGADALIPDRFDPQELALRLQAQLRRKQESDRLRASVRDGLRLALTDPLTGLHNRRYAMPQLAQIEASARQTGRAFAVMVVDLDHFKDVNDTWGHAAGDTVLTELAQRMRQVVRPGDLLARIGGEEFLIVLPETGLTDARRKAEELRHLAGATPVRLASGQAIQVTLSIGLAVGGGDSSDPDAEGLVARADRALLSAKAEGRNQVTVSMIAA